MKQLSEGIASTDIPRPEEEATLTSLLPDSYRQGNAAPGREKERLVLARVSHLNLKFNLLGRVSNLNF